MSHGLDLFVKDFFAASNPNEMQSRNVNRRIQMDILYFAIDCKDLVQFFHNHHEIKASLAKEQSKAGLVSLEKPAPTR